jgi:hypothetical protein
MKGFTHDQRREMRLVAVDLLKGGMHPSEVAKKCGWTATYIRFLAKKSRIKVARKPGSGKRPVDRSRDEKIIVMRASGASLDTVGKHFGVTRERIRQIEVRIARERPDAFQGTILTREAVEAEIGHFPHKKYLKRTAEFGIVGVTRADLDAYKAKLAKCRCEVCGGAIPNFNWKTCGSRKCQNTRTQKRNSERYRKALEGQPIAPTPRNEAIRKAIARCKSPGKWITRNEACALTGLTNMQMTYLGTLARVISTKPHPTYRRNGVPYRMYALSEIRVIARLKKRRPELFAA